MKILKLVVGSLLVLLSVSLNDIDIANISSVASAQTSSPEATNTTTTTNSTKTISLDPDAISLPAGYSIEPFIINLSVPTTAIFDGNDMLIAESGLLKTAPPRILRVTPEGTVSVVLSAGLLPPVTGLLKYQNSLYVSHRGKVSRVGANGALEDIVTGLPSDGDHQNNKIVVGPDGKIYLGQGTVTNSGVVGVDNYINDWLTATSTLADVPCRDITLRGVNFISNNPFSSEGANTTTGAFKPYGKASVQGEVIQGQDKCSGSILRFNPDGTDLEVVAWGLRNPYGLQFDRSGALWTTYHGADVRGSRNIYNDPDYLVKVKEGAWYGWPDYFGGLPVTASRFDDPTKPSPPLLLATHPPLEKAYLTFESHSAANGLTFSPGENFGFDNQAFAAMFGTFAPVTTGSNLSPAGFKVVRIDIATKKVEDFAKNKIVGPSYISRQGGFNRPSDVVFGPDSALYVVDWGAATADEEGLKQVPATGAVWRIYSDKQSAVRANGPVKVQAVLTSIEERDPLVRNVSQTYAGLAPLFAVGLGVIIILIAAIVLLRKRRG